MKFSGVILKLCMGFVLLHLCAGNLIYASRPGEPDRRIPQCFCKVEDGYCSAMIKYYQEEALKVKRKRGKYSWILDPNTYQKELNKFKNDFSEVQSTPLPNTNEPNQGTINGQLVMQDLSDSYQCLDRISTFGRKKKDRPRFKKTNQSAIANILKGMDNQMKSAFFAYRIRKSNLNFTSKYMKLIRKLPYSVLKTTYNSVKNIPPYLASEGDKITLSAYMEAMLEVKPSLLAQDADSAPFPMKDVVSYFWFNVHQKRWGPEFAEYIYAYMYEEEIPHFIKNVISFMKKFRDQIIELRDNKQQKCKSNLTQSDICDNLSFAYKRDVELYKQIGTLAIKLKKLL